MTRGKKLVSLLAVLVVLIGATFAAIRLIPDEDSTLEEDTGTSIFALNAASVSELTWDYGDETLTFVSTDGEWSYAADDTFPLNSTYLDTMVTTLSDVIATKTIDAPDDLSQYGLEEPVCTVSVTAGDTTKFLIGDESSMGGERYISLGDGNVYLVDSSILDSFTYGLYDIVQMESIPAMTNVIDFRVESAEQNLLLEYIEDGGLAYSDSYVWFLHDGDNYLTLDTELTGDFVGTITGLNWSECVSYNASNELLAEYGLDTPSATVTVDYIESVEVETNTSDDEGNSVYETQEHETSFVLEIGSYTDSYCYARLSDSNMVYLIDASVGDVMLYTSYSELLPDEVLVMDWDTVTAIDITLDGQTYKIKKSLEETADDDGNTTEAYVYKLDGEELTDVSFLDDLTEMVSTGSATGLTPERGAEISFTFYRDTETFSEVTLTFYQYDSSSCLVGLNNETRLFVAREDVVSVVEAVNSFCLG